MLVRVAFIASLLLPVALGAQSASGAVAQDSTVALPNAMSDVSVHLALTTLNGEPVQVGHDGTTTLVAVFATWCMPCRGEVPILNMLQREFSNRVRVVAISADEGSDQHIQAWLRKYGARYPVARDASGALGKLGITSVPFAFLVDGAGHIEWQHSSELLSSLPELRLKLKSLPEMR